MKKAFTLSEALVTLAIIGVLAAILIPVINNARPDKDKITYKKALYNLQNAVANAMDEVASGDVTPSQYWGPGVGTSSSWGGGWDGASFSGQTSTTSGSDYTSDGNSFCKAVAGSLNTSGTVNCGSSSYATPNFITTDGIRFWGLEDDSTFSSATDHAKEIKVDRKIGAGERASTLNMRNRSAEGLKIKVVRDGRVFTPSGTDYQYENKMIETSMDVVKKRE